MATASLSQQAQDLIKSSFPSASVAPADGASAVSASIYPQVTYTDAEKKEIEQWTNLSPQLQPGADVLNVLNNHLSTRTTILGTKPSVADIAVYTQLAPYVKNWSAEERSGEKGYHHVVRHVDFVQNAAVFLLNIKDADKIDIDPSEVTFVIPPIDAKAEKERKKKEKEAAAAAAGAPATEVEDKKSTKEKVKEKVEGAAGAVAGAIPGTTEHKKKEKKAKAPKQPAPPPKEKPLTPAQIDLRVGHILKAIQHPNADSLYVSTIAMGDAPGTDNTSEYEGKIVRTVCSGLNGLVPLEEMQGRKIVTVCNLKPVTMRGIKSAAMVLAASPRAKEGEDDHKGPVELVNPPADAEAGERVYFEGWEGEPEPVLNPKKKIWESVQPGFTTTDDLEVGFNVDDVPQLKESGKTGIGKLRTKQGLCTVKTLKGATVR
ncbi:nucleic acid-binding protein [Microthyrium microscopicum]|uniref:Nucleic acid-binding protein n=1 Tax=Microthyrium microscopicum TaxID=703497 RepID=A0A6A6ULS7_9PEZI|nr:nucleic acid-binding protein [Microthyrium microscopicum]